MAQRLVIVMTILGLAQNELVNLMCKEIRQFVDGHNKRRLQVARKEIKDQPGARLMNSVNWDEELAAKAEKWVSTDPSSHNPDRTIASKRFRTGENMFWSISTEPATLDPDNVLSKWFDEYKMYKYGNGSSSPYTKDNCGHYTQMVWSNSTYIGCAISKHPFQKMTKFTVVCNYGPAGNRLLEVPYYKSPKGGSSNTLYCGIADCSKPYGKKCANNLLRLSFDLRITN